MSERHVTRTTVPAQPGWFVAILLDDEDHPPAFAYDPIVAWEIERIEQDYHPSARRAGERSVHHHVIPLTVDGNMETHANKWAIKRPDGMFEFLHETTCDSEAHALEYCASQLRAERARPKSTDDAVVDLADGGHPPPPRCPA
jgi:hypothetical protein